jgi:hypothetical protein
VDGAGELSFEAAESFPAAFAPLCLRSRYARAGGWTRAWVIAIRCRALTACHTCSCLSPRASAAAVPVPRYDWSLYRVCASIEGANRGTRNATRGKMPVSARSQEQERQPDNIRELRPEQGGGLEERQGLGGGTLRESGPGERSRTERKRKASAMSKDDHRGHE